MNVVLWVLQIAAAGMFLMAGFSKLSGNEQMVGMFEAIGVGQWFRYLTGALEVAGAILLLIPRTSGLGALMLAGVMAGAVMTHLFVVGDGWEEHNRRQKAKGQLTRPSAWRRNMKM